MIINVKVKPNSNQESIIEKDGRLIISIKEKPENNKANIAVINLLSKHYKVPVSNLKIKSGRTSTKKLIEVKV